VSLNFGGGTQLAKNLRIQDFLTSSSTYSFNLEIFAFVGRKGGAEVKQ
jgi:hypothetical protein